MIKLGLIISQLNSLDLLPRCLENWIKYKEENPGTLFISIVDAKFKHYDTEFSNSTDGSIEYLEGLRDNKKIDYFNTLSEGRSEHAARNSALCYIKNDITHVLSSAPDEVYTLDEIKNLFKFLAEDSFTMVYKIRYKNLVFDENTYIDDFVPRRIWKLDSDLYSFREFNYDDDAIYKNNLNGTIIQDVNVPTSTIPRALVNPLHYSWLSNERSKKKIEYQNARPGWECSYRWDDEHNELRFNEAWYQKYNKPIPNLLKIS